MKYTILTARRNFTISRPVKQYHMIPWLITGGMLEHGTKELEKTMTVAKRDKIQIEFRILKLCLFQSAPAEKR